MKGDLKRLGWLGAAALFARIALIVAVPDTAIDAYGHMNIARALVREPCNLAVHWVWLPGWHYTLAALVVLGATHEAVRIVVAFVAAAIPFVVYACEAPRSRDVAFLAGVACTLAPLTNILATSAQPEILFTLLLIASTWALEGLRFAVAGLLLLGASVLRYEAWGAVVGVALVASSRAWPRRALLASAIPAAGIVTWIVLRRAADGHWLAFASTTHAFAAKYRAESGAPVWEAIAPIFLPVAACGPALPFAVLGARRAWRPSFVVGVGVLAFLVVTFARGSAIALPRYMTALTPYFAIAMAEGALRSPKLPLKLRTRAAVTAMLGSLLATTAALTIHAVRMAAHYGSM